MRCERLQVATIPHVNVKLNVELSGWRKWVGFCWWKKGKPRELESAMGPGLHKRWITLRTSGVATELAAPPHL